jgi:molybdate transport system permease protein
MMDWVAIRITLLLAIATTGLLVLICLPLATWLSIRRGRLRIAIELCCTLPLVLPPTVLGYYLLTMMSPSGWLGSIWNALFNQRLAFSFAGILIASVLFNLPFMLSPMVSALRSIDARYRETAWCLGLSRWQTWWLVTLPLARSGILTGMLLTVAHCMGEFGVMLMVGGNIPGRTRTIALSMYEDVLLMNTHRANLTAASMLVLCFAILSMLYWLSRPKLQSSSIG